jgi:flagellar motor protein MotB
MTDETSDGLNFWPAFSDSMLAVILVLLLVLGAVYLVIGVSVKTAVECQQQLAIDLPGAKQVSDGETSSWEVYDSDHRKIATLRQDDHDKLLLHITFGDIVFKDDSDELNESGRGVLREIGKQVKKQLDSIVEIQILGHADPRKSKRFPDNLHLASARADAVFLFLQNEDEIKISPIEHAMSAISYGEYFPASRAIGKSYSESDWMRDNDTPEKMQQNRRVELVLRYGSKMRGCKGGK